MRYAEPTGREEGLIHLSGVRARRKNNIRQNKILLQYEAYRFDCSWMLRRVDWKTNDKCQAVKEEH
jgi:hypothetical protein